MTAAHTRRAAGWLAPLLALAVTGCGSSHAADTIAVKRLVNEFAAAHDRRACDLLSPIGLADVYGSGDAQRGRTACVAASSRFRPGPVTIVQIKFHPGGNATVISRNASNGRHYTVSASKTGGHWLIDRITSP